MEILDIVLLFSIAFCGWFLFSRFHFPVADILGSMTAVAVFRIFYSPLPLAPALLSPFIQVCLGLYVGTKITREKIAHLKTLIKPALIIIIWVMVMAFGVGILLVTITDFRINYITGILASTLGGLPEMTIIALETEADVAVVVAIKTIRMIITVSMFPLIFEKWLAPPSPTKVKKKEVGSRKGLFRHLFQNIRRRWKQLKRTPLHVKEIGYRAIRNRDTIRYGVFSFGLAALGGWAFRLMLIPAGALVGGMLFIATASLVGLKVQSIPIQWITFLRVGLGIIIADSISIETLSLFVSGSFLFAAFVNTLITFLSFAFVMYVIRLVTNWDYQTCFLAASPAGFTVMTALALKYEKDVFSISMLHLCRIIVIKTFFPLFFMG